MTIDAVITWVDGSDVQWQAKINQYLTKKIDWSNKISSVRYNSVDEIDLVIKSIFKYAPFIDRIFIVTDDQQPPSFVELSQEAKTLGKELILVDHKDIFRDHLQYLPTFNSCSIISLCYKIPELSEHFIIFNDDTLMIRPTTVADFFVHGVPLIRGKWSKFYEDQYFRNLFYKVFKKKAKRKFSYKSAQQQSAKMLGLKSYARRHHTPVAMRKSTLDVFFNQQPHMLKNNIQHRFRHNDQFMISSFANHLEIKNNTYNLIQNYQLVYFQSYKPFITFLKLWWASLNPKKLFLCLQSLEQAKEPQQIQIFKWVNKRLERKQ